MQKVVEENGIIAGNIYNKYKTRNFIAGYLMKKFLYSFDRLVSVSGACRIHEVGCGEGNLSIRLAKQNKIVSASDFSELIIKDARENARKNGVEINFKVLSIYELYAKDDHAELVICAEVLEHLKDPSSALNVLHQLADPYLIVSVPREPEWRILNFMRGKYITSFGNTPGHLQHWSRRAFLKLLTPYFDVVRVLAPFPWVIVLCRKKPVKT